MMSSNTKQTTSEIALESSLDTNYHLFLPSKNQGVTPPTSHEQKREIKEELYVFQLDGREPLASIYKNINKYIETEDPGVLKKIRKQFLDINKTNLTLVKRNPKLFFKVLFQQPFISISSHPKGLNKQQAQNAIERISLALLKQMTEVFSPETQLVLWSNHVFYALFIHDFPTKLLSFFHRYSYSLVPSQEYTNMMASSVIFKRLLSFSCPDNLTLYFQWYIEACKKNSYMRIKLTERFLDSANETGPLFFSISNDTNIQSLEITLNALKTAVNENVIFIGNYEKIILGNYKNTSLLQHVVALENPKILDAFLKAFLFGMEKSKDKKGYVEQAKTILNNYESFLTVLKTENMTALACLMKLSEAFKNEGLNDLLKIWCMRGAADHFVKNPAMRNLIESFKNSGCALRGSTPRILQALGGEVKALPNDEKLSYVAVVTTTTTSLQNESSTPLASARQISHDRSRHQTLQSQSSSSYQHRTLR